LIDLVYLKIDFRYFSLFDKSTFKHRLIKKKEKIMKARIIAVVNQKGGVGKTTTAVNLASHMAFLNKKTLLIDFDPQGNATTAVGLDISKVTATVYDFLMQLVPFEEAAYPSAFENLHIMPSNQDLAGAEVELVAVDSRETCLQKQLSPEIKNFYDYIVIDCPPSLGLLTLNALVCAERSLIPLQCEYFALEGVAGLMKTLTQVKNHYNPLLEIAGIVMTMFDKRTALNKQVLENARGFFKDLVFDTVIPRNIRLSEAPSHGLPILLYNPYSLGAIAYKNLAEEVISRVN